MKRVEHNQIVEGESGKRYFRVAPGTGTATVYGKNYDGSFGPAAFKSFDSGTPADELRFYLPMIPGEGWKWEITGNAIVEYH